MERLIFLKFRRGNFQQGFEVMLRMESDAETEGNFPAAPNIPELYQRWRSDYLALGLLPRGKIGQGRAINTAELKKKCRQSAEELRNSIKAWLSSENREFQKFREKLLRGLPDTQAEIRVIIQTEDRLLRQLPWQEWDLFSDIYTNAEIALSPLDYNRTARATPANDKKQVRILAILGNSEGINVESDRQFIKSLPSTDPVFLSEPQRSELTNHLWEQDWDILFFAGHSSSLNDTGQILINKKDILTIGDLKRGLRKGIQQGLRIAIFNSCDGLGLARDLQDLHIPQIIVMREPVPDEFAQEFLKHFLNAYANGQSLYLAVRAARERLHDQGFEDEFPGTTWFPVICQNPAEEVLTWQELALGKQANDSEKTTTQKEQTQTMSTKDSLMAHFRSPNGLDFLTTNPQNSLEPYAQLFSIIFNQLGKAGMAGILAELQSEPSDSNNKSMLLLILEKQITKDEEFANKLMVLFKQIESSREIQRDRPSSGNVQTGSSFKNITLTGGDASNFNIIGNTSQNN
jgi:CHAT domain